jgi:uncharacterized membrane protein YjjP (DUF1212 family)
VSPLSEHEQRILEEIEKGLAREDPGFVQQVSRTSLQTHVTRRIRLAVVSFFTGLLMLVLFFLSLWVALAGFAVMLFSGLVIYHYLKRVGKDQLSAKVGRFSLSSFMARLAERLRRHHGKS